jgi:uncharacterized protein
MHNMKYFLLTIIPPIFPFPYMNRKMLSLTFITALLALSFASAQILGTSAIAADKITLTGIDYPRAVAADLQALSTYNSGAGVTVSYKNGSSIKHTFRYETWIKTGDLVPSSKGMVVAGGLYDQNGNPIIDDSFRTSNGNVGRQFFSDCPDGTSLIAGPLATQPSGQNVDASAGNTVFAVVNFEYTNSNANKTVGMYGVLPMAIAVLTLDQNPVTGALTFVKYENVDMRPINGLWIPCAASRTPWGTHLSSEEYEPNAASSSNLQLSTFSQFHFGNPTTGKPYMYGWVPEVTVDPATGKGSIVKHYSMGRFSHELGVVLPDERTVLNGDDSTNAGYFMYIADKAKDLSAGTLYAAKLTSTFSINPVDAPATLSWIKLGSSNDAAIKTLSETLVFSDIFLRSTTNPNDATFTKVYVSGATEWLKLKPNMETAAAFLETRRYAALLGATTQFSKLEGVTFSAKDRMFYSALQNIETSMLASSTASNPGSGPVALAAGLAAGVVTHSMLAAGQIDSSNNAINSSWVPTNLGTLIAGRGITADSMGNTADPTTIANPDNVKFSELYRSLFIGEDCSLHVTCMLWAFNVDTKVLTRIATVPAGAEVTGLSIEDDINGFSYITAAFQHAGDWRSPLHNNVKSVGVEALIKANYNNYDAATIGYLASKTSTGAVATQVQTYGMPSISGINCGVTSCCPGFFPTLDSGCATCPIGYYAGWNASSCTACPSGTSTGLEVASTGISQCNSCAPGYYGDPNPSIGCSPCPTGYYSEVPGISVKACSFCAAGYTRSATGACVPCPAGTSAQLGDKVCISCAPGSFSQSGSSSCSLCPIGTFGNEAGLTSSACSGPCLSCTSPGTSHPPSLVLPLTCTSSNSSHFSTISRACVHYNQSNCPLRLFPSADLAGDRLDSFISPSEGFCAGACCGRISCLGYTYSNNILQTCTLLSNITYVIPSSIMSGGVRTSVLGL